MSGNVRAEARRRQGCIPSLILLKIYTEHIMETVLEDWEGEFPSGVEKSTT